MSLVLSLLILLNADFTFAVESDPGTASFLNEEELLFLANIKVIRKCVDPHWMPLEGINQSNQHIGVIADVVKLVEQKIGIPIKLVPTKSWSESLEKLKSRECDIVTSDAITDILSEDYLQTAPFLNLKNVYITQANAPFQFDFAAIKDKPIGIPKNYPTITLIRKQYGKVNIVEVKDVDEGLLKVSRGELYAFTDLLPVSSYSIQQQGLTNLKVAGHLDMSFPTVMNVRSDLPELVPIFNKTLATIEQATLNQFLSRWIKVEYDVKFDWRTFAKYLVAILAIISLIIYWNRKLYKLNRKLDKANVDLAYHNETDTLTKLYNRNFLINKLPGLVNLANRNGLSLGLAILDIDYFKRLNDTFGHVVGDKCLIDLAEKVQNVFRRESDWAIRYGGDEFILICTGITAIEFEQGLEKLRCEVDTHGLQLESGEKVVYSVSIGYRFHSIAPKKWDERLINAADKKLYQAKKAGRNLIIGS